jgi:hypothetical protein
VAGWHAPGGIGQKEIQITRLPQEIRIRTSRNKKKDIVIQAKEMPSAILFVKLVEITIIQEKIPRIVMYYSI